MTSSTVPHTIQVENCGVKWTKTGCAGAPPARIDEKGRLKVPGMFSGVIQDQQGPDVFVTSLTGECVRIYPMAVWLEVERKLLKMPREPSDSPEVSRPRQLLRSDRRARHPRPHGRSRAHLRESASIVGDVRVFGRIEYLEVWNDERFLQKLQREPWTDEDGLRLSEHGI